MKLRQGIGNKSRLIAPLRTQSSPSGDRTLAQRFLTAGIFILAAALISSSAQGAAALDWKAHAGGRSAALSVAGGEKPGFSLMSQAVTGVAFTNTLPLSRHLTNQVLLNGSGVAAGDVDGDGWCDVYFCGIDQPNALYRNLGGWKFEDIAGTAGVACSNLTSSGAAFADLDGDGDLDLVVNTVGHGTRILQNDGRGHFREIALLNRGKAGMSLALGDLDGDGFLDLYVANYRTLALMDMPNTLFNFATVNGQKVISKVNGRSVTEPDLAGRYRLNARGGIEENGEVDEIYRNQGGKGFQQVLFTGGTFLDEDGQPLAAPPFDWGLSVAIRDLNQDGLPDLWICNDFDTPERIWINQGGGRFRAPPRLAFRKSSHFSMGIDVADINRDGHDDIFVVDMLSREQIQRMDMQGDRVPPVPLPGVMDNRPDYMMNTLFLNRGDGTYAEIAQLAGLAATEWSWTPIFLDVDLDGYEDLLIANGHERNARSLDVAGKLRELRTGRQLPAAEVFENRRMFARQHAPNLAFRNRGELTFEDVSGQWSFNFDGVSHGMCLADLDNDGDLDVLVNNLNGPAGLYRNNSSQPRLGVRLKGQGGNTRGIGARITVRGGAVPSQSQEMACGGRYLSSDDPMRVFAAGSPTNELSIEVAWRSGRRSLFSGAKPNHIYEIDEAASLPAPSPQPRSPAPLFEDVSVRLPHVHHDEVFDDYARQPLLPWKLSQLGPGVAWCDVDADGRDDLVIGSGKGGQLAVFWNDGAGGFQRIADPLFDQSAQRDQTSVLLWTKPAGERALLVGSANYEDGQTNGPAALAFNLSRAAVENVLPGQVSSTGPMALADVDGDGQLDLFVGGRVIAARWPEAASSQLFRGASGAFVPDSTNTARLAGVGLVSGAMFGDLNGDGWPDLVLACEWGPLRIFRNDRGRLVEWPLTVSSANGQSLPINAMKGSWNGVTTGDFDGDGRLDLVATGWGMNTRYQSRLAQPVELLYADFNGDGVVEVVESCYDVTLGRRVTERQLDFLARGLPFLKERWSSHAAFGRATIEDALGDFMKVARRLSPADFRSHVFLNRGDRFEARPLPVEAQFAPAFAVCVADFDGDAKEDLFLSQNFFVAQHDTPRLDAGRGLLLRGDGQGGFTAVPGQESGLIVYGEQRGAAACDYDGDGRVDLVVTQNGAQTKLYRNTGAKPGLRVQLAGPPGNSMGVGAVLRASSGGKLGPAREIHAGSGYWSQDSAVQVLSMTTPVEKLEIRWPGGTKTTTELPVGVHEVTIDAAGKLTHSR